MQVTTSTPPMDFSVVPANEKTFVDQCKAMNFNAGQIEPHHRRIGKPEAIEAIPGAFRQSISTDGSCWSRCLWQNVFNQILNDPKEFDDFIHRIVESTQTIKIPEDLIKGTIFILHHMKALSENERIEYLNHNNVDKTLILYMRHIAADYMEKNFATYTPAEIQDIRTNIHRYGGPEINAFARYFNLATHRIVKNGEGNWVYSYKPKNSNSTIEGINIQDVQFGFFNQKIIFGVNDVHYEVISFPNQVKNGQTGEDARMVQSLQVKEMEEALRIEAEMPKDYQKNLNKWQAEMAELRALKGKEAIAKQKDLAKKVQEDCFVALRQKQVSDDCPVDNKNVEKSVEEKSKPQLSLFERIWNAVKNLFSSIELRAKATKALKAIPQAFSSLCNTVKRWFSSTGG